VAFSLGTPQVKVTAWNDEDFEKFVNHDGTGAEAVVLFMVMQSPFNVLTDLHYPAATAVDPDLLVTAGGNADANAFVAVWLDPPQESARMEAFFEGATDLTMVVCSVFADGTVSIKQSGGNPVEATNSGTSDAASISIDADAGDLTLAVLRLGDDGISITQGSGQDHVATDDAADGSYRASASSKDGASSGLSWALGSSILWRTAALVLEEEASGGETEGTGLLSSISALVGIGFAVLGGLGIIAGASELSGQGLAPMGGAGSMASVSALSGVGEAPEVGVAEGVGSITSISALAGVGAAQTQGVGEIVSVSSLRGTGEGEPPEPPEATQSGLYISVGIRI
jgi:hypothetical protein